MLFADADTVQIVNTVVGAVQAVLLAALGVLGAYIAYKQLQLRQGQKDAAEKVDVVAQKLDENTELTASKGDETKAAVDGLHDVINSNLEKQRLKDAAADFAAGHLAGTAEKKQKEG